MKNLLIFVLGLSFWSINAQDLPKAFMLGEHEAAFEAATSEYSEMLLTACDEDMNAAYNVWKNMLTEMEAYSQKVNYDLKGARVWLNVFWNADGEIKHIAYYLKPNSRNIDTEKLQLFLVGFTNEYSLPLKNENNFSHYGSASFPIVPMINSENAKKKLPGELAKKNMISGSNE